MPSYTPDPASLRGKPLDIREHMQILVIGAGPAGLAAALEAASLGARVALVDENPVASAAMGEDVPLFFGQRASSATQSRNAMMQAVFDSAPELEAALEAGVDVRLGTVAWGLYANGPGTGSLPGLVVGLAGAGQSWLTQSERVIVAAGRRDMGLAFHGWDQAGVMGAAAAHRLATRYGALDARRAVVLGSNDDALGAALALHARGTHIAAIVECGPDVIGETSLADALRAQGVPILTGHTIRRACGDASGVTSAVIAPLDSEGRQQASLGQSLACDTVVLGVAAIPAIELLEAAGCRAGFDAARGGFVPRLDGALQCAIAGVYAAGDCAGIWPSKSRDERIARDEGRAAARHAVSALGLPGAPSAARFDPLPAPDTHYDVAAYRMHWVRSTVLQAEGEPFVCRCEEVTAREILQVLPPRYLQWQAEPNAHACQHADGILNDPAPHPDHVKRLTRAGMGTCQGRRCREQVQALLALDAGVALQRIPLAGYRPPVRPLPLHLMAQCEEAPETGAHWDTWFGMPIQYLPPWDIPDHYTADSRNAQKEAASE